MKAGFFTILFTVHLSLMAQKEEINLQDFAESLFQVQDEEIPYEDLYESLLMYYTNPINLNRTTPDELSSLYILSPLQIHAYFQHLQQNGPLLSLYELQSISHFDLETIRQLLPFVAVEERQSGKPFIQRILSEPNNYLLLRYGRTIEKQAGFSEGSENKFLGDPNYLYGRFRVSHSNDFSLGLTFEKDAGEQVDWNKSSGSYGLDFYSYHLMASNKGKIKSLILGDYQLQMGQGLVFGAGFGAGKGGETVNAAKKNSLGIRPYTSALESGYFRGGAATLQFNRLKFTTMYSRLLQDARVLSDSTYTDFEEYVSSIQSAGLHRTRNESLSKNRLIETNAGAALEYTSSPRLKFGTNILYTHFSQPIRKKPNNYNQFEFLGRTNWVGSIFGTYSWQNFILFAETARSQSGGHGVVGGFLASLTPRMDMSFAARSYERDFHSFYARGFAENSRLINEKGVYWGLKIRPAEKWEIALFYDKFSFPWLKYRAEAPSEGYECLGRLSYKPSRKTSIYLQVRQENKQVSVSEDDRPTALLAGTTKRNYVLNIDYQIGNLDLKTRVQGSIFQLREQFTTGYTLIQDLNYQKNRFRIGTRFALFDTENFDNRQYALERDVLYAFSVPAYAGQGFRNYWMLQYNLTQHMTLWIRWARFTYDNQETISSGINEISGTRRTDLKVMVRFTF